MLWDPLKLTATFRVEVWYHSERQPCALREKPLSRPVETVETVETKVGAVRDEVRGPRPGARTTFRV